VKVASMHFEASTARWLQSVEFKIRGISWVELCSMVHDHFGRDQHEVLIRQLFHIRQSGTIVEYVDQFLELVDQLASYEPGTNQLYYAMTFVDGLHEDIKYMVMIQHPFNLDSACSMALMQEEVVESSKRRDYRKYDPLRQGLHLSSYSAPKLDKPAALSEADDKRGTDAARSDTLDEKLRALRQY
jgi:hypothetical protein